MKKAFSLIELLISLIVISLIIAAFTPMLSTRLKHREIAYSSVKQMKIDCSKFDSTDGQCLLCDENKCNLCTSSINVPDGYFVNPNQTCSRQSCASFDSNCKRCTKDGCFECKSGWVLGSDKKCSQTKCNSGYYVSGSSCFECPNGQYQPNTNSTASSCINCSNLHSNCSHCNKQTGCCLNCLDGYNANSCGCIKALTCPNNCKNCSDASTCTLCENGYHVLPDGSCSKDADCLEITVNGNKICVSKFNAGDIGGLEIPTSVDGNNITIVQARSLDSLSAAEKKAALLGGPIHHRYCWKGNTSATYNNINGTYPTSNRTLCTREAAYDICRYHGWRLPSSAEAATFGNNTIDKGNSGLQLCTKRNSTRLSRCDTATNCLGARTNVASGQTETPHLCRPYSIWRAESSFVAYYASYNAENANSWTTNKYDVFDAAYSVRCVKDL